MLESFGMWFAVVTGTLPLLDRTALRAAEPDYLWLTWPELVEELRWRVDDTPSNGLLRVTLSILEGHQWQKGADELRKLINADPASLAKVLNLDESVSWRGVGKANMAWLWLWQATYLMHAGHCNLRCTWKGGPNAEGYPAELGISGDKLTHAVKAALPLARPAQPLVPRSDDPLAPIPPLPRAYGIDRDLAPAPAPRLQEADAPGRGAVEQAALDWLVQGAAPGAALDAPSPPVSKSAQLVEAMDKVAELCQDFPAEHVARARDNLHTRLAPILAAAPVLLPLLKVTTGPQMGSVIQAAARALATDAQPVVTAFGGWFSWLEDKGLLIATRALKEKALKDVASAMEDPRRSWNWRQEAANVAVQHQEACSPRVMSALLAVADRASFWRAFCEFVLTATSADHIRQATEAITGVSEAQES